MATGSAEGQEQKENKNQQQKPDSPGSPQAKPADTKADPIAAMCAYHVMIHKAPCIAETIGKALGVGSRVLIVDSLDIVSMETALVQISTQLAFWKKTLAEQSASVEKSAEGLVPFLEVTKAGAVELLGGIGALGGLGGLGDLVNALAGFANWFQMDYQVQEQAVAPSDVAFQTLIADRLAKRQWSVYWPTFHRLNSTSGLMGNLAELTIERKALKKMIEDVRAGLPSGAVGGKDKIERACKAAEDCIKQFDDYVKDILSAPEGNRRSPLASALVGERLNDQNYTHLLYLSVVSSSGERIINTGKLREGRASFLGTCVLSYALAESDGKVVCAGTECDSAGAAIKLGHISPLRFEKVMMKDGWIRWLLMRLKELLWSKEVPPEVAGTDATNVGGSGRSSCKTV